MTGIDRIALSWRKLLLVAALSILAYLFALLVPVIPGQVFIRCSGPFCPLTFNHDTRVPEGFTRNYLYSITHQLTGFGSYYNVDEGYNLPSGLYISGLGYTTSLVTLTLIVLPLLLAAIACLGLYIRTGRATAKKASNDQS